MLAGHIPLAFASAASIQGHLKSGKLVPIGVPSGKRSPQYPDVATFAECGVPNFDINSWVGLVAPAKTPAPILQRLNSELTAALNDPAVREKLAASGIGASPGTAAGFGEVIRNELALYGPVVRPRHQSRLPSHPWHAPLGVGTVPDLTPRDCHP